MLILWIRRSNEKSSPQTKEDIFQKHEEDMKKFCHDHPRIMENDSTDLVLPDGDIVAAVHAVKLSRHIKN